MKTRRLAILLACFATGAAAETGTTLDKMRRTGTVTLGVRDASLPLSYYDAGQHAVGFQVDICRHILQDMQRELKLPRLDIAWQPVTAQNRMLLGQNGTVDLECGSTTDTEARRQEVAFSPAIHVEEVRMAVRADSATRSFGDPAGKKVVATAGTTSVPLLRKYERANKASRWFMQPMPPRGIRMNMEMPESLRKVRAAAR